MTRFLLVAFALIVPGGLAVGQSTDEAKQLKDRVAALESKLKSAEKENEQLRKEVEVLKKSAARGEANDSMPVGTKFTGTMTRSWTNNGKPEVHAGEFGFHVTKRSGDDFTAESGDKEKKVVYEGTVDSNNVVKFKITKAPVLNGSSVIGINSFVGRIDNGVLKGTVTKKVDPTYKGEFTIKVKKD